MFLKGDLKLPALLLAVIILPACSGEKNDATWWHNEKQIIELRSKIELANYKLQALTGDEPQIVDTQSPLDLIKEIGALTNEQSRLTGQIAEMQNGWDEFRADVLAQRRAKVIGTTFDTFETAEGREYQDVTISNIDDGGVSFRHKVGTARLRFDDLDQSRREFFGLDGELAVLAHEIEEKERAEYNQWIARGMVAVRAEEAKQAELRKEEEQRIASARALAASNRTSTPSALTASFGDLGDTRSIYSSYNRYGSGYRYRYGSSRYSSGSYYRRPRTRYYYTGSSAAVCPPTWNYSAITSRPTIIAIPSTPAAQCPTSPSSP